MRVGSLCTGYGGLEMGLEAAFGDIDLRFVSDIDKDVSTLLTHHYPHISNLGDLTTVDWKQQDEIDVLTAGYPCQPFSTAGKRKGSEDARGQIFNYIKDAVSVLRPRYLFLENVSGHLTLGGTSVTGSLASMGYDMRWGIVRASDTGAPHKRARWCCLAWNTKSRNGGRTKHSCLDQRNRSAKLGKSDSAVTTDAGGERLQRLRRERELGKRQRSQHTSWHNYEFAIRRWEQVLGREAPEPTNNKGVEPVFVEWLMGVPEGHVTSLGLSRSAELKMLGNGVVPQQARLALQILTEGGVYA